MKHKSVTLWLLTCCAMIFAMAVIGAITRLTESGLSIMEWAPLKGSLPPLSQIEWVRLFGLYQQTGEFRHDNADMDLAGFKTIFWWEWIHRFWGRTMGLVFGLGLAWFSLRGRLPGWIKPHLLIALVLGGLQGTVGWFMVASGFDDGLTDVSHFRLALHLVFALILYAYLLYLTLRYAWPVTTSKHSPFIRTPLWIGLVGLCITITSGALVAGLNAGLIYNEWPLMGGTLVPGDYKPEDLTWLQSALNHDTAIQFNHRWLAMFLGVFSLLISIAGVRSRAISPVAARWMMVLGFLVCFQVTLGIITLLLAVPVFAGALHQAGALALLTSFIVCLHVTR